MKKIFSFVLVLILLFCAALHEERVPANTAHTVMTAVIFLISFTSAGGFFYV